MEATNDTPNTLTIYMGGADQKATWSLTSAAEVTDESKDQTILTFAMTQVDARHAPNPTDVEVKDLEFLLASMKVSLGWFATCIYQGRYTRIANTIRVSEDLGKRGVAWFNERHRSRATAHTNAIDPNVSTYLTKTCDSEKGQNAVDDQLLFSIFLDAEDTAAMAGATEGTTVDLGNEYNREYTGDDFNLALAGSLAGQINAAFSLSIPE